MTEAFSLDDIDNLSAYEKLMFSIRSPKTKETLIRRLKAFFRFVSNNNGSIHLDDSMSFEEQCNIFVEKSKQDNQWSKNIVIKYLMDLKRQYDEKKLSAGTIKNRKFAIKNLVESAEILGFNWKFISKGLPQPNRFAKDRGYSLHEIRKLCEYPDLRIKPIVYVMATSGIRIGAWDYLKWGDVIPHYRNGKHVCSILRVYDETDGEYPALITKEAHDELEKWMNYRKEHGENLTTDSWLMIQLWDTKDVKLENPEKLSAEGGVKKLVESALYRTGLRNGLNNGKKRYDVPMNHGFRKFLETALRLVRDPEISNEDIQILTGHANEGMIDHYYRPSMDANNILDGHLIDEYLRAGKYLIIDEKNKEIDDIKTDVEQKYDNKFKIMEDRLLKFEFNSWIEKYEKNKILKTKEDVEKEIMRLRQIEPNNLYGQMQDKQFEISVDEQVNKFKQYYRDLEEKDFTEEQIKSLQLKPRTIKVHQVKRVGTKDDIIYEGVLDLDNAAAIAIDAMNAILNNTNADTKEGKKG